MLTSTSEKQEKFCRTYDLAKTTPSGRKPFAHQLEALGKLNTWSKGKYTDARGGILALPTGGGKTYTAWRFICRNALSQGYKVLWLAHTHHLLEQAFYSLESEVGEIDKARKQLKVRVVSGTIGHFRAAHIQTSDDVVICTLQSITHAYQDKVKPLEAFLKSAGDRLFVVFDEAHHSPAPSYCRFINALRDRIPNMCLLGLTATPTYSNENRAGWLKQLFPQGILYQVSPEKLMADNILAEPRFETASTAIDADFDPEEYAKWVRDYRDLPESIITALASNQKRNDVIASTYVKDKEKYKKTIIFADRWFQCEYIKQAIEKRNKAIRVDVVFSRVDANPGSADARNQRTEDDNKQAIKKFRNNELDVLINVRMLTEGTDIPDVDTVFLTRQTTSKILLTQMVGRALRGTAAGGTAHAYIVSFVDNWQHAIDWAEYELVDGGTIDQDPNSRGNPPVQLISIDLVRRLTEQMDRGINVNTASFLSMLPLGWYRIAIETQAEGREDSEITQRLVMVFEHEKSGYENFISFVKSKPAELKPFSEVNINFNDVGERLEELETSFFFNQKHIGGNLLTQLFYIARHIAQNEGQVPAWFEFEQRSEHDLDQIAFKLLDRLISRIQEHEHLRAEYEKSDRYWQTLYPSFFHFWSQYTACVAWILSGGKDRPSLGNTGARTGETPPPELSEEVKRRVKQRDGDRCLCCGATKPLEVDHIKSQFHGGGHEENNLQILCKTCNGFKGTKDIDFRVHRTQLDSSEKNFTVPGFPQSNHVDSSKAWKQFLSRSINFFYHCQAVKSIDIAMDSLGYVWQINLNAGNNPRWMISHLQKLMPSVQQSILYRGKTLKVPQKVVINAPGYDVVCEII